MKRQFLAVMENVRTVDIKSTPNYKVMLAIAKHPEAYFPDPELTAAGLKINVTEEFVNDPELFEPTVEAYVKALSRIYDQLKRDFPAGTADRMFPIMMSRGDFTLSYNC